MNLYCPLVRRSLVSMSLASLRGYRIFVSSASPAMASRALASLAHSAWTTLRNLGGVVVTLFDCHPKPDLLCEPGTVWFGMIQGNTILCTTSL